MAKKAIKNSGNNNGHAHGNGRDYSSEIAFLETLGETFNSAGDGGHAKGNKHAKPSDYKTHAANCATAAKALKEGRYSGVSVPINALVEWLLAKKNKDFSLQISGGKPMFAECIARVLGLIPKRIAATGVA